MQRLRSADEIICESHVQLHVPISLIMWTGNLSNNPAQYIMSPSNVEGRPGMRKLGQSKINDRCFVNLENESNPHCCYLWLMPSNSNSLRFDRLLHSHSDNSKSLSTGVQRSDTSAQWYISASTGRFRHILRLALFTNNLRLPRNRPSGNYSASPWASTCRPLPAAPSRIWCLACMALKSQNTLAISWLHSLDLLSRSWWILWFIFDTHISDH